jgi:predicted Abi (CAAX) family protease
MAWRPALIFLRGLHFVGLAMFLGTIIVNIVVEKHIAVGGLPLLADGRTLISLISHRLILQGLGLMTVTGVLMAVLRFGAGTPIWVYAKAACVGLIVAISLVFLLPSLDEATRWAVISASQNKLLPEFSQWLGGGAHFGVVNLLLFFAAGALALWRPSLPVSRRPRSTD